MPMLLRRFIQYLPLQVVLFFTPTRLLAQNPGLASPSGVYNSSQTPPTLPWNTYNFCNAPHVNAAHYDLPLQAVSAGAQLVHVSVVMRHHKARLVTVPARITSVLL